MAKTIDKDAIIRDAWLEWGTMPQMLQLSEEMMELGVEINKKYVRDKKNEDALIEEFGDVHSMMEQAYYILSQTIKDFDVRLHKSMDAKWLRTRRRIDVARKKRGEKK